MPRTKRSWLERSGQAWKLTLADIALFSAFIAVVGGLVLRQPAKALVGLALAIAGLALPFLVRCAVCGLRPLRSEEARTLPRGYRRDMLRILEVCPLCGDDGSPMAPRSGPRA